MNKPDYEKVQLAIELCEKYNEQTGKKLNFSMRYQPDSYNLFMYGIMDYMEPSKDESCYASDIDHVINQLKTMLNDNAKYSIGQAIWFTQNNEPHCTVISATNFASGKWFYSDGYHQIEQSLAFETEKDLIEHQLKKWTEYNANLGAR